MLRARRRQGRGGLEDDRVPGARADFLDWVGKPGVHYPLPPVIIAGPQG